MVEISAAATEITVEYHGQRVTCLLSASGEGQHDLVVGMSATGFSIRDMCGAIEEQAILLRGP